MLRSPGQQHYDEFMEPDDEQYAQFPGEVSAPWDCPTAPAAHSLEAPMAGSHMHPESLSYTYGDASLSAGDRLRNDIEQRIARAMAPSSFTQQSAAPPAHSVQTSQIQGLLSQPQSIYEQCLASMPVLPLRETNNPTRSSRPNNRAANNSHKPQHESSGQSGAKVITKQHKERSASAGRRPIPNKQAMHNTTKVRWSSGQSNARKNQEDAIRYSTPPLRCSKKESNTRQPATSTQGRFSAPSSVIRHSTPQVRPKSQCSAGRKSQGTPQMNQRSRHQAPAKSRPSQPRASQSVIHTASAERRPPTAEQISRTREPTAQQQHQRHQPLLESAPKLSVRHTEEQLRKQLANALHPESEPQKAPLTNLTNSCSNSNSLRPSIPKLKGGPFSVCSPEAPTSPEDYLSYSPEEDWSPSISLH